MTKEMNKLFVHVPTFVETDKYPTYEFDSVEELLQLKYVKRFIDSGDHLEIHGRTLMSVSESKLKWWVIGHLKSTQGIDLPKWKAFHKVKFEDGRVEIRDDVVLSSGDWVQFADGSRATNLL